MKNSMAIDFVVPWVDDRDPVWRAKKAEYTGTVVADTDEKARYRDWDTLKYWFRGVEKFAPWVRYVYFITDDQKPEWLNVDNPKLKWVKHSDYIPKEYLPTFSSHTIAWNLHRIKGLSEHFVYFNDDVFVIDKVVPEDFFVNGLPCDKPRVGPLYPEGTFAYFLFNNIQLLNRHFSLKESIKANWPKWLKGQSIPELIKLAVYGRKDVIPGVDSWHIHTSFNKSTFPILWEKEGELIHATCKNRLRTKEDVTAYCVRNWQLLSGQFYPKRVIGKYFATAGLENSRAAVDYVKKQKGKVVCLNDTENEKDFELHRQMILEAFEAILPEKSSFER